MAELFRGLQALADSTFPKKCRRCGKVYESVADFIDQTLSVRETSGFKQGLDDQDNTIVHLFRNCSCGSTLMEFFKDRRDMSEQGIRRRKMFQEMLELLVKEGYDYLIARQELLKIVRGENSILVKDIQEKITLR